MATITYDDKSYINQNPDIPLINKVSDADMNEIKSVVNSNYAEEQSDIGEFYYAPNDTYEIDYTDDANAANLYIFPGLITSGARSIRFTLTLPKSLKNITSITLDALTLTARGIDGYIPSAAYDFLSSAVAYKVDDYKIGFYLTSSSAWANGTNNTPVNISLENGHIKLTFN